ncbi:MAG: hypothetical protein EOO68_21860 [Moraxellaceae bacterium]|nr:MAG: hypothetical protein EOO68_21860 [Moraxellaceae bacterium]
MLDSHLRANDGELFGGQFAVSRFPLVPPGVINSWIPACARMTVNYLVVSCGNGVQLMPLERLEARFPSARHKIFY